MDQHSDTTNSSCCNPQSSMYYIPLRMVGPRQTLITSTHNKPRGVCKLCHAEGSRLSWPDRSPLPTLLETALHRHPLEPPGLIGARPISCRRSPVLRRIIQRWGPGPYPRSIYWWKHFATRTASARGLCLSHTRLRASCTPANPCFLIIKIMLIRTAPPRLWVASLRYGTTATRTSTALLAACCCAPKPKQQERLSKSEVRDELNPRGLAPVTNLRTIRLGNEQNCKC